RARRADRQDGPGRADGQDRPAGADRQDRPRGPRSLRVPHGAILSANSTRETLVSMVQERPPVYALLADGTTVEIRPAGPGDFDAVKAMHGAMSPDNSYMRFFNMSRLSAEIEARRISGNPAPGSVALLAIANSEVVGVASYVPLKEDPSTAEVAFAVADHMHHRGIATLLLEHLVSLARSRQITTFTAETLSENKAMLGVFADAGLPVRRRYREGVIELTFPL